MILAMSAILTLGGPPTCISMPWASISTASGCVESLVEIPPLETVRFQLDPPLRFSITTGAGDRLRGPWARATVEGVEDEDGTLVRWVDLDSTERLRVARRIVVDRDASTQARWGVLVVAFRAIADDANTKRAIATLRRISGDGWPAMAQAVDEALDRRRQTLAERGAANEVGRLQLIPAHLSFDRTAPWPNLDRAQWEAVAASQRAAVTAQVEGLDYASVPTTRTLVVGPGSIDEQAEFGVRMDRIQEDVVGFLGHTTEQIKWPARMVVVRPPDRRTARTLAAEAHGVAWPDGAGSVVIPTSDGPIVILAPTEEPTVAAAEEVRAVARAVLPYLGTGRRLPGWLVEGIAESVADHLVPTADIDRESRPRAHRSLRAGRDPVWISSLPMDDVAWASDGIARDLAEVMVVHLRERGPRSLAVVLERLKQGDTVDDAFRAGVGMPFSAWTADAVEWFRFND